MEIDYNLPKSACIRFSGKQLKPHQAFILLLKTTSSFNRSSRLFKTLELQTKKQYNLSLKEIYSYLVSKEFILKDIPYLNNYYYENIGGVLKGICDLDGNFKQFNLVKYPTYNSVKKELTLIAKEFPFLNVNVTIYNECVSVENKTPAFSFKISNGILLDTIDHLPSLHDVYKEDENLNFIHLEMFYKFILKGFYSFINKDIEPKFRETNLYSLLY